MRCERIGPFREAYFFLSNFYSSPVRLDGVVYPTVEHAYQAAKTLDHDDRENIRLCLKPGNAKRYGKNVEQRPGWDDRMKLRVMEDLVKQKFRGSLELKRKLLATGEAELVEINSWGDRFWGVCDGKGANHLGRLLMQIREEMQQHQSMDAGQ